MTQVDTLLDNENLKHPIFGYHLSLLSAIAYYGDGSLSQEEMEYLHDAADRFIKKDISDRELVKKETLLEILDVLRDVLSDIPKQEERYKSALNIAKVFSEKMKVLIKKAHEDKEKQKELIELFNKEYESIAKVDGKIHKNEKKIISTIKYGLGGKKHILLKVLFLWFAIALIASLFRE